MESPWETLGGNNIGWIGCSMIWFKLSPAFLLAEVFEREQILNIFIHTRET